MFSRLSFGKRLRFNAILTLLYKMLTHQPNARLREHGERERVNKANSSNASDAKMLYRFFRVERERVVNAHGGKN